MGDDFKGRREFLRKIRNWMVGGLYAMIPLHLIGRRGGNHLFEVDTEKRQNSDRVPVTCNCEANTAVTVIARNQADQHPDHTGCACASMDAKEGTRSSHVPWQCTCRGRYTRADAHAAAQD